MAVSGEIAELSGWYGRGVALRAERVGIGGEKALHRIVVCLPSVGLGAADLVAPVLAGGEIPASAGTEKVLRVTLVEIRRLEESLAGNAGDAVVVAERQADLAGVKAALDNYARAMENGDMYALKAVMQLNSKDEQKLPEVLNAMRGKGYALEDCSTPDISGTTAKVNCDAVLNNGPDSKRQRTKFQLAMMNGRWMIVSAH